MHILVIPAGLILWYLAYENKPSINDEVPNEGKEENILKRNRLISILKESY
tara:strand:- start:203 stop:355 length:153 start_codon:yes stop_codon:yes gene_type:complete